MSNRFNPLSTGVAVATATVILGIAGCAMNTPSATTDQTDTAGLSRQTSENSPAVVAQADPSTMPSAAPIDAPAMPAGQWVEPAPVAAPLANDTAVIPRANQSTAMAAPVYPSATTTSTDTGMTTTTTSTDTLDTSRDQPLPARSDRN